MIHNDPPVTALSLKKTISNQLAHKPKRIKLKTVNESDLQKALIRYARSNKICCFAIPNGGQRNIKEAVNLKSQGVMAGVTDLIVLEPDRRTILIEVKVTGNGLQESQITFRDWVKSLGHEHHVLTSHCPHDAVEQLKRILYPSSFRGYSGAVR